MNKKPYSSAIKKTPYKYPIAKVPKELLPVATTLYTPDWAVRYMAENSLGRLWLEGHPNDALKKQWKYYIIEATQFDNTQQELNALQKDYAGIRPNEILCLENCTTSLIRGAAA